MGWYENDCIKFPIYENYSKLSLGIHSFFFNVYPNILFLYTKQIKWMV